MPRASAGVAPGVRAGRSRDHSAEIGRTRNERCHSEGEDERSLHEHRQREIATRSLEREPVGRVPCRDADREPRERKQAGEHERVLAHAEPGCAGGDRDEKDRCAEGGCHDHGGQAIDERRALDIDAALPPESAELTVGLEWAGSATSLEARLGLLRGADEERGEREAADDLHEAHGHRLRGHPIAPIRTATRSATTSAMR